MAPLLFFSSGIVLQPVCVPLGAADGVRKVATMVRDIVQALKYAAEMGYLHRDVSMGNVMWDPVRERGCLIDWHIAVRREDLEPDPVLHTITGTRHYTAVSLSVAGHQRCVQVNLFCS